MNLLIPSLNNKFVNFLAQKDFSLGLANGKIGFCIYYYYVGAAYKNVENNNYNKIADKLLEDIFENIASISCIDVKNGLAGIALGINYLLKKTYAKGNPNIILNDIDDIIFKNLSYLKYSEKIDSPSLVHILYYLSVRVKDMRAGSENEYLFQELIIKTVNNLYENLSPHLFEEPLSYNTDYAIPQLLFVMSEIYKLNFYNHRLTKILEELGYKVLSTFPLLHSNRLYLLWGMNSINKQIKDNNWTKHIRLLKGCIDINHMLNIEMNNKNIFFNDGYTSIYYLINDLYEYFDYKELIAINNQILNKISSSDVWVLLNDNQQYFENHLGLYNGFTGVTLLLQKFHNQNL